MYRRITLKQLQEIIERNKKDKEMEEKTVFEEIADTIEEDKKHDEEFTLELRTLVKKYYPYNIGHEITITWPKDKYIKFSE